MTTNDVKRLAKIAYPDYKGRKFRIEVTARPYQLANFWDGGSRSYARAVELSTGRMLCPTRLTEFPYDSAAHIEVPIPDGWAILERRIFMGKEAGITLYIPAALGIAEVQS